MSGRVKGVRAHITAEVPHALYVHCGAHALTCPSNTQVALQQYATASGP